MEIPYNRKYYITHRWINTNQVEAGTAIVLEGELGPCHIWQMSLPVHSFQYLTFLPQGLALWQTGSGRAALLHRVGSHYVGTAFIDGRNKQIEWKIEYLSDGDDVKMSIRADNQPYLEINYLSTHSEAKMSDLTSLCPYIKDLPDYRYLPIIHQRFCLIIFIFICLISTLSNNVVIVK